MARDEAAAISCSVVANVIWVASFATNQMKAESSLLLIHPKHRTVLQRRSRHPLCA